MQHIHHLINPETSKFVTFVIHGDKAEMFIKQIKREGSDWVEVLDMDGIIPYHIKIDRARQRYAQFLAEGYVKAWRKGSYCGQQAEVAYQPATEGASPTKVTVTNGRRTVNGVGIE